MNSPRSTNKVTDASEEVRLIHGHTPLAFSPDYKLGYIGRSYDSVTVDIDKGETVRKYDAYSSHSPLISPDGRFVYTDPGRYIKVIDTQTHKVENGHLFDHSISAMLTSADGEQLYVLKIATLDVTVETLSIISSALPQTLIKEIAIGKNPTAMVLHPHKPVLYISCAQRSGDFGGVYAIDLTTDAVTRIPLPSAWSLAISPDGDYLYTGQLASNSIVVVDTMNNGIKDTFNIRTLADHIAVSLDKQWLYVLTLHTGNIDVYDTARMTFHHTINTNKNDLRSVQIQKDNGDLWATYYK